MTQPPNHTTAVAQSAKDVFFDLLEAGSDVTAYERILDAAPPTLREEALRLLASHSRASNLLTDPRHPAAPPHAASIPGYELYEELGRGAFGAIYRGRQLSPVERDVAIKLLHTDIATTEVLARFRAEARILARLEHPGIARVIDAGVDNDNRPFVAMELVQGKPLTEYAQAANLSLNDRITLMRDLAQAVHHAHQRAVLHRDLKPSNVLVELRDGRAMPRIIDFGIARLLDDAQHDALTRAGARLGTPRYMSPEQSASSRHADVRMDVYALGMIFCELLTGKLPRSDADSPDAPKPPSSLAADASLASVLRGDLDAIVLKAVALDAEDRYASAAAFADDLDRYLQGLPVTAARPTTWYLARKFVRRNRIASVMAAVACIAVAAGTTAALLNASRAEAAREHAQREQARAEAVANFVLDDVLAEVNPNARGGDSYTFREHLSHVSEQARQRFSNDPELLLRVLQEVGESQSTLWDHAGALVTFEAAVKVATDAYGPADRRTLELRLSENTSRGGAIRDVEQMKDITLALESDIIAALGPDDVLSLQAKAAALTWSKGAERLNETIALRERIEKLGHARTPLHQDVLSVESTLLNRNNDPRALDAATKSASVARELYGLNHSSTLNARYVLTRVLRGAGKFQEAEREARDLAQVVERVQGETSSFHRHVLVEHYFALDALNDLPQAIAVGERYIRLERQATPDVVAGCVRMLQNLAELHMRNKQPQTALHWLEESQPIVERVHGPDSPRTRSDRCMIARALIEAGRVEEARPIIARDSDNIPPNTPDYVKAMLARAALMEVDQGPKAAAEFVAQQRQMVTPANATAGLFIDKLFTDYQRARSN
ncbi:MAG: protein kinase domain-containing protein [Phycisphaerae bacterium]|jgi:non-specific serine/threonine protein kinase/serine/threonine-protein kinase